MSTRKMPKSQIKQIKKQKEIFGCRFCTKFKKNPAIFQSWPPVEYVSSPVPRLCFCNRDNLGENYPRRFLFFHLNVGSPTRRNPICIFIFMYIRLHVSFHGNLWSILIGQLMGESCLQLHNFYKYGTRYV